MDNSTINRGESEFNVEWTIRSSLQEIKGTINQHSAGVRCSELSSDSSNLSFSESCQRQKFIWMSTIKRSDKYARSLFSESWDRLHHLNKGGFYKRKAGNTPSEEEEKYLQYSRLSN